MYIVVRADLPPGLQVAQAVHAAFLFAHLFPDTTRKWLEGSNIDVILSVPDEAALTELAITARCAGVLSASMTEPDIGNQLTALALGVDAGAQRLCANLPLALRERTAV